MSLTDNILPGNRIISVNGMRAPQGRDRVDIVCVGAEIADDSSRQLTRVTLPSTGSGVSSWALYTPALTSDSSVSIGNGSVAGSWRFSSADTLEVMIALAVGSTTSFGAGALRFSLPTIPSATISVDPSKLPGGGSLGVYSVSLADNSTPTNNRSGRVDYDDVTHLWIYPDGVSAQLTANNPFVWAANDHIRFSASMPVVITGV